MSSVRVTGLLCAVVVSGCGAARGRWAADPEPAWPEARTQAEIQIRRPDGAWSDSASATVVEMAPAIYPVRVINVGHKPGRVRLREAALSGGWRARYFDALSGGVEITDRVRDGGWYTTPLKRGEVTALRIEMSSGAERAGRTGVARVYAYADSSAHVTARTTVEATRTAQPVVKLRPKGAAKWAAALARELKEGQETLVEVLVRNAGDRAATVRLTALVGTEGWRVTGQDAASGRDVSRDLCGKGVPLPCAPGGSRLVLLRVSPQGALRADRLRMELRAAAGGRSGVARLDVLMAGRYQPDLQIGMQGCPWAGDGVYEATAARQTAEVRADARATVSFWIRIENDGDFPDRFVLRETGHDARWLSRYFDAKAGGGDITGAVRGEGWTSRSLRPGEDQTLRYQVTPGAAPDGSRESVRLSAVSAALQRKGDAWHVTVAKVASGVRVVSWPRVRAGEQGKRRE